MPVIFRVDFVAAAAAFQTVCLCVRVCVCVCVCASVVIGPGGDFSCHSHCQHTGPKFIDLIRSICRRHKFTYIFNKQKKQSFYNTFLYGDDVVAFIGVAITANVTISVPATANFDRRELTCVRRDAGCASVAIRASQFY